MLYGYTTIDAHVHPAYTYILDILFLIRLMQLCSTLTFFTKKNRRFDVLNFYKFMKRVDISSLLNFNHSEDDPIKITKAVITFIFIIIKQHFS